MRRWEYVVLHWQDVVVYMVVGKMPNWIELGKLILIPVVSVVVSVYVNDERLKNTQKEVERLRQEIDVGILPVAKERLDNIIEDHQKISSIVAKLQEESPMRCLQCHMSKTKDHHGEKK